MVWFNLHLDDINLNLKRSKEKILKKKFIFRESMGGAIVTSLAMQI